MPRLGSKFHVPRKTVAPSYGSTLNADRNVVKIAEKCSVEASCASEYSMYAA